MLRASSVLLVVAALACGASAQSRYQLSETQATGRWWEITGPPTACAYPNFTPFGLGFLSQVTPCFPLTTFGPLPGDLRGDITDDMTRDLVYVTDGTNVAEYSGNPGVQTNDMPVAIPLGKFPLTGLGFDSAAGILWITDGFVIFGVYPSAPGSCAPPTLAVPAFAVAGTALTTDVTWSPALGLVFGIDSLGNITGYTPAGAVTLGPWPAGGLCPLPGPFTGIAADTATGCNGSVQAFNVTDGISIIRVGLFGTFVPPTFYDTQTCGTIPFSGTEGLAWAARPIVYGTFGGPQIRANGQSVLPNPTFAITLGSGPLTGNAWLLVGPSAPCTPTTLLGQPLLVSSFTTLGPFPFTGGSLMVPAPLPAPGSSSAPPCGLSVYLQWFVKGTSGPWKSSDALEMTFSLP